MSEYNETGSSGRREGSAPASGSPSSSSVGRELARLREERGWSQEYVSDRLKYAVRQIRALESERWNELPQGMPLRGFVRNYARLLEADPAPLLQALSPQVQMADPVSLDQASSLSMPLAQSSARGWPASSGRKRLAPWLIGGIMAVLALALLGYALDQQGKLSFGEQAAVEVDAAGARTAIQVQTPLAPPTGPEAAIPPEPVAPPAAPAVPEPAPARPASEPAAAEAPAPQPGLTLALREPSWVEIRRADGSVAVSRIIPANEPYELDASGAPYRVVIGNVNGVDLSWRGAAVDLAPYRRDNVARLTLQ
ncbi:MAG: helix-turn-helix domain-containing protein [Pigmentiphaga sp.]|uniref:helix-turn-helix domain-containing protein n=1 Tax=Pigmentiphaga sp. TaxID=1977564 RepID=UPI0029AABF7E|nr:helix-turn-helix domain-containing protein [Pigmentiphaga sp.]MDX3905381.1 helix-turn-helix domain-containing protein [Pigmentiphaga sp.]